MAGFAEVFRRSNGSAEKQIPMILGRIVYGKCVASFFSEIHSQFIQAGWISICPDMRMVTIIDGKT
jgi:hypothetical protein